MKKQFLSLFFLSPLLIYPTAQEAVKGEAESTMAQKPVDVAQADFPEDCFIIDEAVAVIEGQERTHVVCKSDLERATFHGRAQSLNEVVEEELALQDAIKFKVPIDETASDRYIASLCKQHNLKREDVDGIFKNSGLTPQEGRAALTKLYTKQMMVEQRVLSRLMVPEHEAKEYYEAHPEYKEAKYTVSIAFVPRDSATSEDKQLKDLQTRLARSDQSALSWCDPFSLKESDIAEDKKFITRLKVNEIAKPLKVANGYQVFQLVKKRDRQLIAFEKRYREIVDELRAPKMAQSVEKYFEELKKDAHVGVLS